MAHIPGSITDYLVCKKCNTDTFIMRVSNLSRLVCGNCYNKKTAI